MILFFKFCELLFFGLYVNFKFFIKISSLIYISYENFPILFTNKIFKMGMVNTIYKKNGIYFENIVTFYYVLKI